MSNDTRQDFSMFRKERAMLSITPPQVTKEGKACLFLNGAIFSKELGKMDWNNKITVKLDLMDVGKIIHGVGYGKDVDIYHKAATGNAKQIQIANKEGECTMFVKEKGEVEKTVFMKMTPEERIVLNELLKYSLKYLAQWV